MQPLHWIWFGGLFWMHPNANLGSPKLFFNLVTCANRILRLLSISWLTKFIYARKLTRFTPSSSLWTLDNQPVEVPATLVCTTKCKGLVSLRYSYSYIYILQESKTALRILHSTIQSLQQLFHRSHILQWIFSLGAGMHYKPTTHNELRKLGVSDHSLHLCDRVALRVEYRVDSGSDWLSQTKEEFSTF